jgi:hypothetical protein
VTLELGTIRPTRRYGVAKDMVIFLMNDRG